MEDGHFTRLKPDLIELVTLLRVADQADKEISLIVRLGNPVAAAHVEPRDLIAAEELAKVSVDCLKGGGKIVASLFAESVKVQSAESGEVGGAKFVGRVPRREPGEKGS